MERDYHDNDETTRDRLDALLDRLVDGELSGGERRDLLESLDRRSDGWRRCALAFLEAQAWRGGMRQAVNGFALQSATEGAVPADPSVTLAEKSTPVRSRSARAAGAWLATAAGLLVAFGLGRAMSPDNAAPPTGQVAQQPHVSEPGVPAAADQAHDADVVTLVVDDGRGRARRVRVPLVAGDRLGRQFGDAPQWAAAEVRRRLAEQGVDLQARRRYAPLFFEEQDRIVPLIVPVDDAVVTPVSRQVY